jgi:hypothetical protein
VREQKKNNKNNRKTKQKFICVYFFSLCCSILLAKSLIKSCSEKSAETLLFRTINFRSDREINFLP